MAGPARSREYTEDGRHRLGVYLQAPLLASLTTGPICIVASPGPVTLLDGAGRVSQGLRMGLGIQAALGHGIAVHPEVSYVDEVAGAAEMSLLMVGLGFAFPNLAGQRE
jgi:hypothetical protein